MTTSHIYHPEPLTPNANITLTDQKSHHLCNVLRMKKNTTLTLFNGDGFCYHGTLIESHKRNAIVHVTEKRIDIKESPLSITVAQALAKGDKMDFMLQKAVELGANAFVPLITQYSQVKLNQARLAKRQHHWNQVIISACEQCKRNTVPELHDPTDFNSWLQEQNADQNTLTIMLDPQSTQTLSTIDVIPKRVIICIGPEGGFSEHEMAQAKRQGIATLRFGPRILRTETAAMAMISAMQSRWGDLT